MHRPVTELAPANAGTMDSRATPFDIGHFGDGRSAIQPRSADAFTRYLSRSPVGSVSTNQASAAGGLIARAGHAASRTVLMSDQGRNKLNTPYLLRVLTSAVAQSAYRPYWKRSVSQPFGEFGSTVGSDAGKNVLHEFQPGILDLLKSHTPKFISRIEARLGAN